MTLRELLQWQWEGYPRYHQERRNLLLHIVAVPVFLIGNVDLVLALASGALNTAAGAAGVMVMSFLAQGYGHGREPVPSVPFSGPGNAVARIFLEQWITFPRFVLSGAWLRALRQPPGLS